MLQETRRRLAYKGRTRGRTNQRTGELEHRSQRQFSAPPLALTWTMVDQMMAVDHGYFFERVMPRNAVRVIPLRRGHTDSDVCNELERAAFHGDRHALKALLFIEQQDRQGWSGSWGHPVIETYNPALRWYKMRKQAHREVTEASRGKFSDMAKARWNKAAALH